MTLTRYQVLFDGVEGADSAVRTILLADLNFSHAEVDAILSGRGTIIVDTDSYEFASIRVDELKKAGGKVKLVDISEEENESPLDVDIEFSMEDIVSRPNSVAYQLSEEDLTLDISEPEVGDLIASLGSGLVLAEDAEESAELEETSHALDSDALTLEDIPYPEESEPEPTTLDSEITLQPLEEELEPELSVLDDPSEDDKTASAATGDETIEDFWQMSLDILPEEESEISLQEDQKAPDDSIESQDLFSFLDEPQSLEVRGLESSKDTSKAGAKEAQASAFSDSDLEFSLDDENLIIADEENGVQGLGDTEGINISVNSSNHPDDNLFEDDCNSIITEDFKQRVKSEAIPMPDDNFEDLPSSVQSTQALTPPNYMTIIVVSVGIVVVGILYLLMTGTDDLEVASVNQAPPRIKKAAPIPENSLKEEYNLQQVNVLKATVDNESFQSSKFECVLIDNLARCRFEIETVPPPELTRLEIVKGVEIRPWLRKLSLQTVKLSKIAENTYAGYAQARVYVDLPERLRIVAAVGLLLEIKPDKASLHIQVANKKDKVNYQRLVPDEISIKTIRKQSKKKADFFLATTVPLQVDESVAIAQPEILEAFQQQKPKKDGDTANSE